jgi:hypothetical protein
MKLNVPSDSCGCDAPLQAAALLMQQVSDRIGGDLMPGPGQLGCQHPRRFRTTPRPFTWTKDADEILASINRAKTKANALTHH